MGIGRFSQHKTARYPHEIRSAKLQPLSLGSRPPFLTAEVPSFFTPRILSATLLVSVSQVVLTFNPQGKMQNDLIVFDPFVDFFFNSSCLLPFLCLITTDEAPQVTAAAAWGFRTKLAIGISSP